MNNENVNYNPFSRGPFPVGVLTQDLYDSLGKQRKRKQTQFPTEIWYPATDEYRGKDLSEETKDKYFLIESPIFRDLPQEIKDKYSDMDIPRTQEAVRDAKLRDGTFPLIIFSHGFGGFRRGSSHLCCHLASHGYVVVSPDHIGNTLPDMMSFETKTEMEIMAIGGQVFINRPRDIKFLINCMLGNKTSIPSDAIKEESIGVTGHSYGGWTILMATSKDERISAALPIASSGGALEDPNEENFPYDALDLNWNHEVPTLYLAAEKDTLVPIASMYDLYNRTQEPKSMVVLNNADHIHFATDMELKHDFISSQPEMIFGDIPMTKRIKENMLPFSELCPAKNAEDFLRGLGLAHMDAYLKKKSTALEWLKGDIKAHMAEQGVSVSLPKESEILI